MNLFCGDTATGGTHEVHCLKPDAERCAGLLEDRSSKRVDVIPAVVASVSSPARNPIMLAILATLLAGRYATGKPLLLDRLKANVVSRKLSVKLVSGIT